MLVVDAVLVVILVRPDHPSWSEQLHYWSVYTAYSNYETKFRLFKLKLLTVCRGGRLRPLRYTGPYHTSIQNVKKALFCSFVLLQLERFQLKPITSNPPCQLRDKF